MFPQLFRSINRLNPTFRGRHRVMNLAQRLGALPPEGIYVVDNGLKMRLRPDQFMDRSVYFHAFEPCVARALLGQLHAGDTFIDVGANIGYYTLAAARIVGPTGRVISFEPQPRIFARLCEHVQMNGLGNVTCHPWALADQDGELQLHVPPAEVGFGHASLAKQDWAAAECVPVPVRRLDDLLLPSLERLDVIKLDAEGAELAILQGARQLLHRFHPHLVVELNAQTAANFHYHPLEIVDFLHLCYPGYRFLFIDGHAAVEKTRDQMHRERVSVGDLLAWDPHRPAAARRSAA